MELDEAVLTCAHDLSFWAKIRNIMFTPTNSILPYIKWGFLGYWYHRFVYMMIPQLIYYFYFRVKVTIEHFFQPYLQLIFIITEENVLASYHLLLTVLWSSLQGQQCQFLYNSILWFEELQHWVQSINLANGCSCLVVLYDRKERKKSYSNPYIYQLHPVKSIFYRFTQLFQKLFCVRDKKV